MSDHHDEFFKSFTIIIVVIYTLIQGSIDFLLAVYNVLSFHCATKYVNPVEIGFNFAVNLIYFTDHNCEPPLIHLPKENENVPLKIDYSVAEVISDRHKKVLLFYCTICIFWIITSYFVLIIIFSRLPNIVVALSLCPWFLVIMIASFYDIFATWYHVKDVFHTSTAKAMFEYLGIEYNERVLNYLADYDDVFASPAKLFTLYSCRCVLFWIMNIFAGITCINVAIKIILEYNPQHNDDQESGRATSVFSFF